LANDKVTSSVDFYIKLAYESTFEPGKAVYKEILEDGMLRRIEEVNPKKACELRIEKLKKALEEEESKLNNLKTLELMEKTTPKKQNKKTFDPRLEKKRLEKWEEKKDILLKQYKSNNLDFNKVANIFFFDNVNETKEWLIPKLQEAELYA
jgi:hypothetical protein